MPSTAAHRAPVVNRRGFLTTSPAASAGVLAVPAVAAWLPAADAKAATAPASFVDDYRTNTRGNLTPETNAVVRALGGFGRLWKTGSAWHTGMPLRPDILRADLRYCARITAERTDAQAEEAFVYDRQHQSYAVIAGLGPLAEVYRTGAKAVTSITSAPDGTPPTTVSDAVPADAPAGSALGAGGHDSPLGKVAELVDTVRGPYASGNPAKYAYQYPRPWRLTEDSEVVDTGRTDAFGFPVYASDVVVAPQLLRQRGASPADDGGFPSGHTNAFHLAAPAYAYAVPERFQELVTRASELSHTRIVAGTHHPVDVVGGRIMATALAAAALADAADAELKAAARAQALAHLTARTGTTADTLYAYAHPADDPYADRDAHRRAVRHRLTYVLPRQGGDLPLTVPKGAEVLLETRLPYLTAEQRRAVRRGGRLRRLRRGRHRHHGRGGRRFLGGRQLAQRHRRALRADQAGHGNADADRPQPLHRRHRAGRGHAGGGLRGRAGPRGRAGDGRHAAVAGRLRVRGVYAQEAGTLEVTVRAGGRAPLTAGHRAVLGGPAVLALRLDTERPPAAGSTLPVLGASRLAGRFDRIEVNSGALRAVPVYTAEGLSVRLVRR